MKNFSGRFLTKRLSVILVTIQIGCTSSSHLIHTMPEDFVYISDIVPGVHLDIRYYGTNNFVCTRIEGYEAPVAILSQPAAFALKKANEAFMAQGYAIRIFDAYRPQTAVNHFIRWAENPADTQTKTAYYPHLDKSSLFTRGYIATRSSHSRGSTVDLTLIDCKTGKELDMGSSFDFFDPVSRHGAAQLTAEQIANREILSTIMKANGFKAFSWEWWHYTLENEPYPDSYFDFVVR
jgi:D-alanyl-D-alanine dipeptidase